ncbi:MAG: phosphonate ABC transporter ATP-binding protein [Syntrophorhabdales bacterium]|jgi:phosphonate transport system ATP-binding protein
MIRTQGLTVSYSGVNALYPMSVVFREQEFTALLGPSGAGKSTLLRSLNLLIRPSSGSIMVNGVGVVSGGKALRDHRRCTAMIFQQHQLLDRQTALHNVLIGRLGYHSTLRSIFPLSREEQIIGLQSLERVGLLQKAMERVDRLSGGERQRVGIARCLAQKPRIILADEPVASLDPATAEKVMSLLGGICREDGITAIVSLHQVSIAKRFADRVLGLTHGRIVFDGTADELTDGALNLIYNGSEVRVRREAKEVALVSGDSVTGLEGRPVRLYQ